MKAYSQSDLAGHENPAAQADKALSAHLITQFNIIEIPGGQNPQAFINSGRPASAVWRSGRARPLTLRS